MIAATQLLHQSPRRLPAIAAAQLLREAERRLLRRLPDFEAVGNQPPEQVAQQAHRRRRGEEATLCATASGGAANTHQSNAHLFCILHMSS